LATESTFCRTIRATHLYINSPMPESKDKVIVKIVEAEGSPGVVHGALGGPAADGSILMRLYSEMPKVPEVVYHPVKDGKVNMAQMEGERDVQVVRTLQPGVYLTPHTARLIATWLNTQADVAESKAPTNTEVAEDA